MSNITIVIPNKKTIELLKKLDKAEECGDDENYWIREERRVNEMYLENDGTLHIDLFGNDEQVGVDVVIDFKDLMNGFSRFNFFETLKDYVEENINELKKDKELLKQLKLFLKDVE